MKFIIDTHTHTLSSGHAYSTIQEMAKEAKVNGIELFVMTDHGPAMKGAPYLYHFGNLKTIPKILYGVRIVKGVEANIIDYEGNTDMPVEYLKRLEFVIASFHDICIRPSSIEDHTRALVQAIRNPYIDAIAHSGNPQFQIDIEQVVRAAKENNKLLEINNHSFTARQGSEENCLRIAEKCRDYGVSITCGSDAHISFDVGKFDQVYALLSRVNMPEELIMNLSIQKFEDYLRVRQERLKKF